MGSIYRMIGIYLLLVSLTQWTSSKTILDSCPSGWTGHQGSCYKVFYERMTWTNAEKACNTEGGNLASIPDIETSNFIHNIIKTGNVFWSGGYKTSASSPWRWTDNSPFNFQNWYPGNPDNFQGFGGSEFCIEFWKSDKGLKMTWNDNRCDYLSNPTGYVCKKAQNAVLIIGGWDNPGNAEVFFPDTAIGCSVPFYSFRDKVHSTTMDTVGDKTLICGGGGSSKECFQFTPVGSATAWRKYSDLNITRYEHTSWASKQGPVLIGGYEPSGKNAEKTAELNGRILPFSLPSTRDACAITDSDTDSVIVTGGDSTKIKASRYNMNGLVEELPTLNRGRSRHGCGSYTSSNKLVLIVAGGDNAGGKTTEKFMIGDTAWTLVGNLPRSTFWISGATISMNNKIYIFGGDEGATNRAITDILEYEAEQDTWNKIGDMKRGRYRHATAVIEADQATLCATK